jgi:hypothetical protein
MKTLQQADKPPLIQTETMTWNELLDRLLAIQRARNLPPHWIVDRPEECGHPPKAIWRPLAKSLGFTQYWADWRHLPGHETEEPEPGAIDWERWPAPEAKPNFKIAPPAPGVLD